MKPISISVIFIIILIPINIYNNYLVKQVHLADKLVVRYNSIINRAVEDAAYTIITNANNDSNIAYKKRLKINKDLCINTIFSSLKNSIGSINNNSLDNRLKAYIPALLLIEYDGYYIYSVRETVDESGDITFDHTWSTKRLFTTSENNKL